MDPFELTTSGPQAYELSVLTGTQVLLLVVSETGLVYTFTTPKLQPLVTKPEGKNLIQVSSAAVAPPTRVCTGELTAVLQACLNAPEPPSNDANGVDGDPGVESPEDNSHAQMPAGQPRMPPNPGMPQTYMTPEQHLQYQTYLQQQQATNQYPMPPQAGRMPAHPHQQYPTDQKLS